MNVKKLFVVFLSVGTIFFPMSVLATSPPDTTININENTNNNNPTAIGIGGNQHQTAIGTGIGIGGEGGDGGDALAVTGPATSYGSTATVGGSNSSANSVSGVDRSGNSIVTHKYPPRLITALMIQPVVLDDQIFSTVVGMRMVVDGMPVLVVSDQNIAAIRLAMVMGKIQIIDTAQEHGKKAFVALYGSANEYRGPIEQIRKLVAMAPEGTECVLVEVLTLTHTRGVGGAGSAGDVGGGGIATSLAANLSGSFAVPVSMTTATYLDRDINIINCYRPSNFNNPVCLDE